MFLWVPSSSEYSMIWQIQGLWKLLVNCESSSSALWILPYSLCFTALLQGVRTSSTPPYCSMTSSPSLSHIPLQHSQPFCWGLLSLLVINEGDLNTPCDGFVIALI